MTQDVPIRDAATVIVVRRIEDAPKVLMGQRGAAAVFMPDKFVFPGGAVDADDMALVATARPDHPEDAKLLRDTDPVVASALPLAAIRELWEETGLRLGRPDPAAAAAQVPEGWQGFFAAGLVPNTGALRLVFRAITPPGRPRRFDARFFVADAQDLFGTSDDFSAASGELLYLRWLDLAEARALPLPFITEVVLAELEVLLAAPGVPRPVPFFNHTAEGSHFHLL